MSDYQITCCSTADLPLSFFEQTSIPFACFHYELNGTEYPDDLGQTVSFDTFYSNMKKGAMPTTSQVNVEQYTAFFEPFLAAGKDVLHLALSSGISGVINSAQSAAELVMEQYPGRKVYVVDSLGASSGYGLLMDRLADLRDAGMTVDEARDWALANRPITIISAALYKSCSRLVAIKGREKES